MKSPFLGMLTLIVLVSAIGVPSANCQSEAISTQTNRASQKSEANALKWKEKILKVPVGSYVKGKLENHQEFEGQLRDISESAFSIQRLTNGKIEMMAVRYEEMKSLSVAGRPSNGEKVAKTLFGF